MNWRYAVGEVLLIVIGVTIALAANSWWEERKARDQERAMLVQLRSALEVDLQEFEQLLKQHVDQERDVITLVEHMEGDEAYRRDMNPLFRSLRRWRGVAANVSAYEALKSRGLDTITNDELRNQIIYFYEEQAPSLTASANNDRTFVTDRLNPYTDRHFISIDPVRMEPLDYGTLRNDIYFRNLCMMKLFRLQNFILPTYQRTNKMVRDLIVSIDEELGSA